MVALFEPHSFSTNEGDHKGRPYKYRHRVGAPLVGALFEPSQRRIGGFREELNPPYDIDLL
jgi:hypothetical protein